MTIADVIERIYRDFLARATDTPTLTRLASAITNSTQSIELETDDLTPEEQSLLSPGTQVEIELELVRTISFDEQTGELTAARGQYGTTAAAHDQGDVATIAPAYSRHSVFTAVADAIDGLYPELWATSDPELITSELAAAFPEASYLDVLSVRDQYGTDIPVSVRRGFGEVDTAAAILYPAASFGADTWVVFKKALVRPTAEDDELADLGVSDRWVELIVIDSIQSLTRGHELDRFTLEFLTEAIESSGLPPGNVTDIATGFLRYREYLMAKAKRALYHDHPMRVQFDPVI